MLFVSPQVSNIIHVSIIEGFSALFAFGESNNSPEDNLKYSFFYVFQTANGVLSSGSNIFTVIHYPMHIEVRSITVIRFALSQIPAKLFVLIINFASLKRHPTLFW